MSWICLFPAKAQRRYCKCLVLDKFSKDTHDIKYKFRDDLNIKSKQLSKINSETILEYHAAVSTKNTYVANRMVGVIRKLYTYAKLPYPP